MLWVILGSPECVRRGDHAVLSRTTPRGVVFPWPTMGDTGRGSGRPCQVRGMRRADTMGDQSRSNAKRGRGRPDGQDARDVFATPHQRALHKASPSLDTGPKRPCRLRNQRMRTWEADVYAQHHAALRRPRASSRKSDSGRCARRLILHRLFPKAGNRRSGRCPCREDVRPNRPAAPPLPEEAAGIGSWPPTDAP